MNKPLIYETRSKLPQGTQIIDTLESAKQELFFIENPQISKNNPDAMKLWQKYSLESKIESVWVYYPSLNMSIHIPQEEIYFKLRTARNRNIITEKEQLRYRNSTIGIAGLSVGSAALAALLATGGPKNIKIADPDIVEISNLNRIAANLTDINQNKTDVAARVIWTLDPFANVELWREGVSVSSIRKFLQQPRLDIYVDEMDDIRLKFEGRRICKELHIPVVMATDNGDGAILDIERFDIEPDRPIFHGRVRMHQNPIGPTDRAQFLALANQIIDVSLFDKRQYASILEIGKTLSGVAQLGTAARIAGVSVAYAVRMILAGENLPSGRYLMKPETEISAESNNFRNA